ncbi:MAG: hypothetical protein AAGL89_10635 [Pseudomonadota bacterium]
MTTRRTALGLLAAATSVKFWPNALHAQSRELTIKVTQPSLGVAPMAVFLEAEISGSAVPSFFTRNAPVPYRTDFHEVTYIWTLPNQQETRTPEHLVDEHRRRDRVFGPFISHVFSRSGPQDVRVDAFLPDGTHLMAETVLQIGDPSSVFGPANTILVSAIEPDANAPDHQSDNAVATLTDAFERLDKLGTENAQILLARGQVHTGPLERGLHLGRRSPNCHIGAWGDGPRPIIDLSHSEASLVVTRDTWEEKTLVIRDLHFKGGWDPTTELWSDAHQSAIISTRGNASILLHQSLEEGCAITVNSRQPRNSSSARSMTVFNEYTKTNFKDFLLLGPRDQVDVGITGCLIAQHPDALNGGENRGATSYALYGRNAHNFIRCSADRLYVASNDIFIRHGWALNRVFDNPAFRLNRNDIHGMRAVIARNHIEGMIVRASRNGAVPMNLMIEQNYLISNPSAARAVFLSGGAATLRNNIILEHDTPKLPKTGSGFRAFVTLGWDGADPTTRDMPILIYNNSFICLRGPENTPHGVSDILNRDEAFTAVQAQNNILWAPSLGVGDGPLNMTSLSWDSRYRGARLGWARAEDIELTQNILPEDTVLISYWVDFLGFQLTRASFAGEVGRHAALVDDGTAKSRFEALTGDIALSFDPDGVRLTNLSGQIWPHGAILTLHCDRGTTPSEMNEDFGHPSGTVSLYQPTEQSPAWRSANSGLLAFYDFLGKLRPGTTHPASQEGRAHRGAIETRTAD